MATQFVGLYAEQKMLDAAYQEDDAALLDMASHLSGFERRSLIEAMGRISRSLEQASMEAGSTDV